MTSRSPISPVRGSPRRGRGVGFATDEPVRHPKVAQVTPVGHYDTRNGSHHGISVIPSRMSPGSRIGDGREDIGAIADSYYPTLDDDDGGYKGPGGIDANPPDRYATAADCYFALNMEDTLNQTDLPLPDTTLREVRDHRHLQGPEVRGHRHFYDQEGKGQGFGFHKQEGSAVHSSHSSHYKAPKMHQYSDPYSDGHKHIPTYHHSSLPEYEPGYPATSKISGSGPGPIPGSRSIGNPVSIYTKMNLSQWQQNLDSQNTLQQQMHHLHLDPPPYLPSSVSGTGHGLPGSAGGLSYPAGDSNMGYGVMGSTSANMEGLIRAKEGMLHERNITIERQKLEITHLQKQIEEQENIARQRLFARSREDSDVLFLKMQEYQYEIASLRAQLAEVSTAKMAEGEHLSRKLGEVEESHQTKDKTITDLRKKLRHAETRVEEKEGELDHSRRDYDKLKKRVTKMERYMHDLPTADEYRQSTDTINELHQEEQLLRERITDLEASLLKAKQKARKAKHEASEQEDKNNTLTTQVDSMKREMSRLHRALGSKQTGEPTDLELCSRDDITQLRDEKGRLSTSVEHLKKVIESKHRHMQKSEGEHQRGLQELETRLQQEEGVNTALRMELNDKDRSMQEMSRSMKELASQSQELYDHNLTLQESIQSLERVVSSDKARLTSQLIKELTACVQELQQLLEICNQGAHGQEPNVSLLLGFRPSSVASYEHDDDEATASEDLMKAKLSHVQKLRGDIDILRNLISDKYAEDVGSNCITQ